MAAKRVGQTRQVVNPARAGALDQEHTDDAPRQRNGARDYGGRRRRRRRRRLAVGLFGGKHSSVGVVEEPRVQAAVVGRKECARLRAVGRVHGAADLAGHSAWRWRAHAHAHVVTCV